MASHDEKPSSRQFVSPCTTYPVFLQACAHGRRKTNGNLFMLTQEKQNVVLSGIRATGRLHFGNFIGAVQNFVKYQQQGNLCMYFIADLHTLTTNENPEELRTNLIEIVKDYLAAGLDPEQCILYAQSSVPEIPELCLYLS